jgi:hypothetical protein
LEPVMYINYNKFLEVPCHRSPILSTDEIFHHF